MISKLLSASLQIIVVIVPLIILSSDLALAQPGENAALHLVDHQIPSSFTVHGEGNIGKGYVKAEEGHIVSFELHEENITWTADLTWHNGRLMSVNKQGSNPVLGRELDTVISIEYRADGRLASQEICTEGVKRLIIRYKYDEGRVPTGATVHMNGRIVEVLEYKYDRTALTHPLYINGGFYFGQVETYSTWGGQRHLFSSAELDQDSRALKSITLHEYEDFPEVVKKFYYLHGADSNDEAKH